MGGPNTIGGDDDRLTDRLDAAFTHPILGALVFVVAMALVFFAIYRLAELPMTIIEDACAWLGSSLATTLPPGDLTSLLVDGVIGGVAGTVVFLPQICLLFFLLALLEDTGYLARAAFVMDRIMCRFGLPGQAFVPLLSSHACALPGIMSTRLIPDPKDRLATILVAPFMSCSARVGVYVLLVTILFPHSGARRDRGAHDGGDLPEDGAAGEESSDGARASALPPARPARGAPHHVGPRARLPEERGHGDPRDLHRALVDERLPEGGDSRGGHRARGARGRDRGIGERCGTAR
ncbi:MAG: hypothetical protein LW806_09865 [Planctomycetaceae bacterium]|nr:hypothetical protein [Planctomycetaceae bacterium]